MRPSERVAAFAGRDSGSRNHAATKFAKHSAAANHIGVSGEKRLSRPPIAGPKMKPRPKAAPISPIPRARFSGVVTSAIYACAVGNVGAGDAADDARHEQQRERTGERHRDVREARAEQADQDDGLAPDLIRPAAPDRREQELHQREAGAEQPDRERRRAERLGVERQQRNDDAETEQVDEDGNEQNNEGRHSGSQQSTVGS